MPHLLNLTLSFSGEEADNHQLDFYDAAQALIGFERSVALTTHFVMNGEIITQAPSLRGAKIFAVPPTEGSWELTAAIITAGAASLYKLGTAPRETPIGHLVSSLYDYVIARTLGFTVDYDKTLRQQFEELHESDDVSGERVDSLVEKIETAVKQMHRPIVQSKTAAIARIYSVTASGRQILGRPLTQESYERMQEIERTRVDEFAGGVSSYNINTYRGRMYLRDEQRPIPFELAEQARDPDTISKIGESLALNAAGKFNESIVSFSAFRVLTKTGRLKAFVIVEVG